MNYNDSLVRPLRDPHLVPLFQIALFFSLLLVGFLEKEIDLNIERVWQWYFLPSAAFSHDSFEVIFASFCFAINISVWYILDTKCSSDWLHSFRLRTSKDMKAWRNDNRLKNETLLYYVGPFLAFDLIFPRRTLPDAAPSLRLLALEVAGALFFYDIYFYFGHRLIHKIKWLCQFHMRHHSMKVIRAGDSVRHSVIDGAFDVACSVAALNTIKAHPLSRSVYNVFAVYLITEAHSGYNFPWMLHNVLPFVFAGPCIHDIHHTKGNVNFQKFFLYLDYVFQTSSLRS
jgi:methylsterol monooxygenase